MALRLFDPWGVDVVSGVERELGKKDEARLHDFVAACATRRPRRSKGSDGRNQHRR
jgi:phosphoribosylanthranilate isomerase